jgi:hypothetical protein
MGMMIINPTTTGNIDNPISLIKLTKNTKGYNWEITLSPIDLEKLEEIDTQLRTKYSQQEKPKK